MKDVTNKIHKYSIMKKVFLLIIVLLQIVSGMGQTVPTPAKKQDTTIIIIYGNIHIGNGKIMNNKAIVIREGKIAAIQDVNDASRFNFPHKLINATGKEIYPGLIAPSSQIGLAEIDAVRATRDGNEVGEFNSNVRSIISYNTDSRVTPTIRSNGILLAQVMPNGGLVSGTSSVVQLDAWNWEDAVYKADDGMWMNWPNIYTYNGWWAEPGGFVLNKNYDKHLEQIKKFFREAKAYCNASSHDKTNLKLEAMRGVFDGRMIVYIRADEAKTIYQILDFKKEFNINIVIQGGNDAWLVAKEIAEAKVPIMLDRVHTLPTRSDEDYDLPYKKAKILKDAGILYCLGIDGYWQIRNLPFMAGTTVAYGISKEDALSSITLNTAKILGIDKTTGSIEEGKDANIIISKGDVLDMRTNIIEHALIQGRIINLGNKQTDLYQKFSEKYNIK